MTDTVNVPREALREMASTLRAQVECSEGNLVQGGCEPNLARVVLGHFLYLSTLLDDLLAAAPKAEPVSDPDDIETLISDAIADSLDMDWTSRDGARAVMRALEEAGLLVSVKPEATKVEQEPVAWRWQTPIPHVGDGTRWGWTFASHASTPPASINAEPLYTSAPASDELLEALEAVETEIEWAVAEWENHDLSEHGLVERIRATIAQHKGPQS